MAAAAPPAGDDALHQRVTTAVGPLRPAKSRLRNGISSHRLSGPVAFPALEVFAQATPALLGAGAEQRVFLGSVDGELYLSAQVRAPADDDDDDDDDAGGDAPRRKRQRDNCGERAEDAVKAIRARARAQPDAAATLAAVELARTVIEQLLRSLKGAHNEEVVESCGLSLAPAVQATASAGAAGGTADRPRLIIAARLSAGVPMPLLVLRRALGDCFKDGMVTTRPESLGPSYQLPLSAAGQAVEQTGQRSMLLFAAVPIGAHPPAGGAAAATAG